MVCGPSRTIGIVSILLVWSLAAGASGCSLGPRALERTRLPYNEAVKVTTEEQLLLNIVRLRYTDSPSSLGVTTIAAQFELQRNLQLTPFFAAAGSGSGNDIRSFFAHYETLQSMNAFFIIEF